MAHKIKRKYIYVALMTASLLSTILKTTWTQPMLLATCGLLKVMLSFLVLLAVIFSIRTKKPYANMHVSLIISNFRKVKYYADSP